LTRELSFKNLLGRYRSSTVSVERILVVHGMISSASIFQRAIDFKVYYIPEHWFPNIPKSMRVPK